MPKIKTNRAAAKRFRKTGSGKFAFSKSIHFQISILQFRYITLLQKKQGYIVKNDNFVIFHSHS